MPPVSVQDKEFLKWLLKAGFQAMDLKIMVAWACLDLQSESTKHFNAYIHNTDRGLYTIQLEASISCLKGGTSSGSLQHVMRLKLLKAQS